MKINSYVSNISFSRAFTTREKFDANNVKDEALKLLKNKERILIVPEFSMPMDEKNFLGYGQLNSSKTFGFIDFMKTYAGVTTLKVLPQGEYDSIHSNNYYPAYRSSSLTLGPQVINLEDLTKPEYNSILSNETLNNITNKNIHNASNLANIENAIGKNSDLNKALSEAYENFLKIDNKQLQNEFKEFKTKNYSIIEKKALFDILSDKYASNWHFNWTNNVDKNLFNSDFVSENLKNNRINELKKEFSKEFDFVLFKQFLAEKSLKKVRKSLQEKNVKLMGDCLVAFSNDEIWGYPKAFEKYADIGSAQWGIRALNYPELIVDNSEAQNLLKLKVTQFAKRYDAIRFDIGWGYVSPILYPHKGYEFNLSDKYYYDENIKAYKLKESLGGKVLDIIEKTVEKIQGKNFDKNNLIYEIEGGAGEFSPYKWENDKAIDVIDAFKGRRIIQSNFYMHDRYATIDFFKNMNMPSSDFVYMSGNHDHLALNALAQKIDNDNMLKRQGSNIFDIFNNNTKQLARKLNISEYLLKNNSNEFVKAKWAYLLLTENIKMFFMDVFGKKEQFDSQCDFNPKNYRYMINGNYEEAFHVAVQKGNGLNMWDAIAKNMKAQGFDKSHSFLYEKVLSYANILAEKGVKTEIEANNLFDLTIKTTSKKANTFVFCLGIIILAFCATKYLKSKKNSDTPNANLH